MPMRAIRRAARSSSWRRWSLLRYSSAGLCLSERGWAASRRPCARGAMGQRAREARKQMVRNKRTSFDRRLRTCASSRSSRSGEREWVADFRCSQPRASPSAMREDEGEGQRSRVFEAFVHCWRCLVRARSDTQRPGAGRHAVGAGLCGADTVSPKTKIDNEIWSTRPNTKANPDPRAVMCKYSTAISHICDARLATQDARTAVFRMMQNTGKRALSFRFPAAYAAQCAMQYLPAPTTDTNPQHCVRPRLRPNPIRPNLFTCSTLAQHTTHSANP
jgi:hypothetical protein